MFSILHLQYSSPHGLTISVSLLLFSLLCLPHLPLLLFIIPDLLNPLFPIIHLNILISVLSSNFFSASLSAQVSLPYIRTGLMTVLYNAALSIMGVFTVHLHGDWFGRSCLPGAMEHLIWVFLLQPDYRLSLSAFASFSLKRCSIPFLLIIWPI